MRESLLVFVMLIFMSGVNAQEKPGAIKIDEFGWTACGEFMARAGNIWASLEEKRGSTAYVLYYEGKSRDFSVLNKKLGTYEKRTEGPIMGEARNYALGIGLYLRNAYVDKTLFDPQRIVLMHGGVRESMALEVWLVPSGAALPKPSPTVDEKSVVFRKGKLWSPRDCSHAYDGY